MIRKLVPFVSSVLLMLVGCGPQQERKNNSSAISGVPLENMDSLVRPGDNFAAYVNGNSSVPEIKRFYQFARSVGDSLLEETIHGKPNGIEGRILKDFYRSLVDFKARDSIGLRPLLTEFEKIDAIQGLEGLLGYFGYANIYGYNVPLQLDVVHNINLESNIVLLSEGGLSLGRPSHYLEKDGAKVKVREDYSHYIQTLFKKTGHALTENQVAKIIGLEIQLARLHMNIAERGNPEGPTFLVQDHSENMLIKDLALNEFLKKASIDETAIVATYMIDYLEQLATLIRQTDLRLWKHYLKWLVISSESSFLDKELLMAHKAFHNDTAQPEAYAKGYIKSNFSGLIDNLFIERYCPDTVKIRVEQMVDDFIDAFTVSISELDWMTDTTRQEALLKLKKLKKIVGYVESGTDYSSLKIVPNKLFENRRNLSSFKYQQKLAFLELKAPIVGGKFLPRVANGYYLTNENRIWIAAIMLNPPYFMKDADDAVNYGAIGAVIGHELGHGFDSRGSEYDSEGEKRNWWTDKDREEFDSRTSMLVDQFNGYEIKDGHFVDGTKTLDENIADLTGLNMAVRAYTQSKNYQENNILDGFTPLQRLFIGYATMYNSVPNDDYHIKNRNNRYPPARYRVNGVVRNIDAFYKAFEVAETDSLYLSPEKRVKIW
nr:M13 family metallopeptidase [Allomuricauda sp.]